MAHLLLWQFTSVGQALGPLAAAAFWVLGYPRYRKLLPYRVNQLKLGVTALGPLLLCVLAAKSAGGFFESLWSRRDVAGFWISDDQFGLHRCALFLIRCEAAESLLERLLRAASERSEISLALAWNLWRRVATLGLYYACAGGVYNLLLPALAFDLCWAYLIDAFCETGPLRRAPKGLLPCLDIIGVLPHLFKALQLALLFLRLDLVVFAYLPISYFAHLFHVVYHNNFLPLWDAGTHS